MNLSKKIIGIILSVLMIVSVIPMAAFAAEDFTPKAGADVNVSDDYITGLNAEGSTLKDVQDQIEEALSAVDYNGAALADTSYVGTGAVITSGASSVTAVLYGDVDGDGAIDAFDLFKVDKDLNGIVKLAGVFAVAGDTDHDGSVDMDDYKAIRAQIAGEALVDQAFVLPKATITEITPEVIDGITPDAEIQLVPSETAAEIDAKSYADWDVDLVLSFDKAVNKSDFSLAGSYGSSGWIGGKLGASGTLAADEELSVIHEWLPAVLERDSVAVNYAEIVKDVQNFKCAIYSDVANGVAATIKLVVTDPDTNTQYVIDSYTYTWAELPEATIDELVPEVIGGITPDAEIQLSTDDTLADIEGKDYADWDVDLVLSFNQAVDKKDIYLAGKYDKYDPNNWMGGQLAESGTLAANEEFSIVHTWLPVILEKTSFALTYTDIVKDVRNFKCAIYDANATYGLVATVKLVVTDGEGNQHVIDTFEYMWTTDPVAPEVIRVAGSTVGEIPYGDGSVSADTAVRIDFKEIAEEIADREYAEWKTDVVVSFNKALNAEDVYFFGNYANTGWIGGNIAEAPMYAGQTIAADQEICLVADWFGSVSGKNIQPTYEEVLSKTGDKLAAIHVDGDTTDLIVTVKITLTDNEGNVKVLAEGTYSYAKPVAPKITRVATDTIGNNGAVPYGDGSVAVDAALKMEFQETVADIADKEYKDWPTDVVISFNKDLNSEDVYLFGKYGTHEWMGGNLEGYPINANEGIALVDWFAAITGTDGLEVTYEDVIKRTGDKLAALHVDGDTDGLVVTVSVVVTDPVTGEKTVLKSNTYSYAKPVAPKVTYLAPTDLVDDGEIPYGDTTVKADTAIKMEFKETPDDIADKPYKDWKTDVVISFSEDLNGEDVYIFGKYATLNWMGGNLEGIDITADTGISLIEWFSAYDSRVSTDITYSEVIARMGEKLAALHIDGDTTDLKVTVKIILTDPVTGEEMILEQGDYTYINVPKPKVEIVNDTSTVGNAGSLEGYISNDVVEADVAITMEFAETAADVADKEYKDWNTDIEISFNQDLNAEDVYFFGKYGSYDWIGDNLAVAPAYNGKTIKAGETVSLVSKWFSSFDSRALAAKYSDVLARQDYKSAALYVAGAMAGLEITVNIVLTDPDTGARVVIASGDYTYGA